ncbi:MAG: hypothetical protein ACYSUI_14200 [Planctomycetota bacterium]|jgi:hypothetical protein
MTTCRWKLLATALAFAGALSLAAPPAFAVDEDPPGFFELDGNPQDANPLLPDDWEQLYLDCMNSPPTDPTMCANADVFTGIVPDPSPQSIFFQGGSKNDLDIPRWNWKDGSTPDKDDITNAFAAGYVLDETICVDAATAVVSNGLVLSGDREACTGAPLPDTISNGPGADQMAIHFEDDLLVYFGMDIFDNEGDKFGGFWFFQNPVGLTDPTDPGSGFDGTHAVGDINVSLEFPQANDGVPNIEVIKWVLPADEDIADNLQLVASANLAECDAADGISVLFCAISNNPNEVGAPVPTIWPYADKDGFAVAPPDPYPHESFISGGINLTRVAGGIAQCITDFMAQTRASRSIDSKLWDFVLGDFETCSAVAVTEIHDVGVHNVDIQNGIRFVDDMIHDSVEVTGTNIAGAIPDPTGDVTFTLFRSADCTGTIISGPTDYALTGQGGGVSIVDDPLPVAGAALTYTLQAADTVAGGNTSGHVSYRAVYNGDTNYPAGAIAACEKLEVQQPRLRILKDVNTCLDPDTLDTGKFTMQFKLQAAGSFTDAPNGANVAEGGDTGFFSVAPGDYDVSERKGTTGPLLDEFVKVYLSGTDCDTNGQLTLSGNQQKTCRVTNIRKPHLKIVKVRTGIAQGDSGLFDLQVDGTTAKSGSVPAGTTYVSGNGDDVGASGDVVVRVDTATNTGLDPAAFGSHTLGESAGATTDLSKYQTSIVCNDDAQTNAVFGTGGGDPRTVTVNPVAGELITCTITNIPLQPAGECIVR